ncbi:MAG: hypothetical protein LBJ00_01095 [Planctomycetaceae bacterium]|jgi:hypothetical protein|nr:hypothetical protein [Planctomycetaceae bacterium]
MNYFLRSIAIAFLLFYGSVTFADVSVVVQVTSTYEVVKPGVTAQYTVSGSYNGTPSLNTEEEAGTVEWQYGGGNITADATISPSAAETTWSASNTRTISTISNNLGEYILRIYLKVRIQIKNKTTGAHIRYIESTGRGSAKLKVTNGKFKIVLVFDDDFAGRSKTRMGVGEGATITVEAIDPVGGTTTIESTSGTGNITVSGTSVTAGNFSGSGTITVTAKVNGKTATTETLGVTIVAPTGVRQEKIIPVDLHNGWTVPVTNPDRKLYVSGYCSVGMRVASYLNPTDVSFHEIDVGEGTCEGTGTGSLLFWTGNVHPRWKVGVSTGNIAQGCRVEGPNKGQQPPYDFCSFATENVNIAAGTCTWNIPCEYHCNTNINRPFAITIGKIVLDGKKGVTVSKAGNSVQHTSP